MLTFEEHEIALASEKIEREDMTPEEIAADIEKAWEDFGSYIQQARSYLMVQLTDADVLYGLGDELTELPVLYNGQVVYGSAEDIKADLTGVLVPVLMVRADRSKHPIECARELIHDIGCGSVEIRNVRDVLGEVDGVRDADIDDIIEAIGAESGDTLSEWLKRCGFEYDDVNDSWERQ